MKTFDKVEITVFQYTQETACSTDLIGQWYVRRGLRWEIAPTLFEAAAMLISNQHRYGY